MLGLKLNHVSKRGPRTKLQQNKAPRRYNDSSRYTGSNYKDKTVMRPYLCNRNLYAGKATFDIETAPDHECGHDFVVCTAF